MGFGEAVKTCFSKYFQFSGRAARSEYWWFFLFVIVVSLVLAVLDAIIFGTNPETGEGNRVLSGVFQLATLVVLFGGVAVFSVLEQGADNPDALRGPAAFLGMSGLIVVSVLQLALSILMIWWLTRPSEDGTNQYGAPVS